MDTIKSHRSIRKYSSRVLSDELLQELLSSATRTQTMGNLQLYSAVVTRSQEMKRRLAPLHFNQPMVRDAQAVITVCADFCRTSAWCNCRKAQPGYGNFLSFVNAATDALLFTQTLSILCEHAGLGVCFLRTTLYSAQEIIETLELPKLTFPVATLTVGYPDENPPMSDRLPIEAIVHKETYTDYTQASIDSFYKAKEELAENQNFVKINAKETLAQIFTDIRYPQELNEKMSQSLLDTLRRQGFMD